MVVLKTKDESKFTYKNLLDLNDPNKAYNSPLAVICHIDMNAFFAQCEQHRLGLSDDDPVVCLQWNSLIAVSYAAREYGITRMDRLEQAKLKCPNLIAAHTAVFKKGDPLWKYVDYVPSRINHKVSLDPYRREGKKILNLFRSECDLVEKASVDESFMDLGRLVFQRVIEAYSDILCRMSSTEDKLPPLTELPSDLEFRGYVIAKTNEEGSGSAIAGTDSEYIIEDWDDLLILIGSQVCYDLRQKVQNELGYKTSGGVGRVKTIAKLASGFQKPDQQTIVRNDSIPMFLKYFKVTDFWSLGGKVGELVKEKLEDDNISTIRDTYETPEKLIKLLDNDVDLGTRLYKIVRGELRSKVEAKETIKSMMSNKNFRGNSVKSASDLIPWLNVFIGELILRNQDLDEENKAILRPIKITLSASGSTFIRHSKQCTINQPPKDYDKLKSLYHSLVDNLVKQLEAMWKEQNPKQPMYPIMNAGLGVSSFIDLSSTNTLDDLMSTVQKRKVDPTETVEMNKKPKPDILQMFRSTSSEEKLSDTGKQNDGEVDTLMRFCTECNMEIAVEEWQTHQDFHVAMKLDTKLNKDFEESYGMRLLNRPKKVGNKSKGSSSQMKLPF